MILCAFTGIWRVRGRVGRNLAVLSGIVSAWCVFLFLEYQSQSMLIGSPLQDVLAGYAGVTVDARLTLFFTKLFSTLAGVSVFIMAGFILFFAYDFPPRTKWRERTVRTLQVAGTAAGMSSYFGVDMAIQGTAVTRTPTIVMYLHALAWFGFTIGAVALLFRKAYALTSPLRRSQVTFFPIALLQAVILGGVIGYALPTVPAALVVTALAPSSFAVTMILGMAVARGLHQQKRRESRSRAEYRPPFARLQTDFGLTYREATICELIDAGYSRPEILGKLGIMPGTLKAQLNSIFRKTLLRDSQSGGRDKLQRLTVFLRSLAEADGRKGRETLRAGLHARKMLKRERNL